MYENVGPHFHDVSYSYPTYGAHPQQPKHETIENAAICRSDDEKYFNEFLKSINVEGFFDKNPVDPEILTKSKPWEYEHEQRCVIFVLNDNYLYR